MKLSIVVPVYNEEKTVIRMLAKVMKAKLPSGVRRELIVIDDGSEDKTKFKIKNSKWFKRGDLRLVEQSHKGKGAAVRNGLAGGSGEIFLIQDADLEYDPKDYCRLLGPIMEGKVKVVYGSRLKRLPLKFWGKSKTIFPSHYIGNKMLTLLTNWLYGGSLTDMETGYKVFSRDAIGGMRLVSDGFEIEPELTGKILRRGYTIYEVPIKVKPRGYNEGKKIYWWHGAMAMWALVKFRISRVE